MDQSRKKLIRKAGLAVLLCISFFFLLCLSAQKEPSPASSSPVIEVAAGTRGDCIKWVDFTVTYEALCTAYDLDVEQYAAGHPVRWTELLAYAAAKTGGKFDQKSLSVMRKLSEELSEGSATLDELTKELPYYPYYLEAYEAVLGGMVGEYEIEQMDDAGRKAWKKVYGLKAFSPIAKGFDYSDYDDFGSSRSYGYKRPHLGHDMMGQVGTPITAIESGYVEALGWNQYGGWRVGIRYMGHTGYSTKENTNNIDTVHLHWGLQLIFDESQKEGNNEIWIDCYALTRFLSKNRSLTEKNTETKEWLRCFQMRDPAVNAFLRTQTPAGSQN